MDIFNIFAIISTTLLIQYLRSPDPGTAAYYSEKLSLGFVSPCLLRGETATALAAPKEEQCSPATTVHVSAARPYFNKLTSSPVSNLLAKNRLSSSNTRDLTYEPLKTYISAYWLELPFSPPPKRHVSSRKADPGMIRRAFYIKANPVPPSSWAPNTLEEAFPSTIRGQSPLAGSLVPETSLHTLVLSSPFPFRYSFKTPKAQWIRR